MDSTLTDNVWLDSTNISCASLWVSTDFWMDSLTFVMVPVTAVERLVTEFDICEVASLRSLDIVVRL